MPGATAISPAEILHHAASFLSGILVQHDLRHHLISTFRRLTPVPDQDLLRALNLAEETLENAISTSNPSVRLSSLCLAENLLLSESLKCATSSFLLSLFYSLCCQPTNAASSLLDMFSETPSLGRSEVAPRLFEELFLVHLIPVMEWFDGQRSQILSSSSSRSANPKRLSWASDDFSYDFSVVMPSEKLLSSMSGDQAAKLKELEETYEEVIDENCRVLSKYFKDVVRFHKDGSSGPRIGPPAVVLKKQGKIGSLKLEKRGGVAEQSKTEELKNGRYNPIWSGAERRSADEYFDTRQSSSPPSYPQRVSPDTLTDRLSSTFGSDSKGPSPEEEEEEEDDDGDGDGDDMSSLSCASSSSEFQPETKDKNRKTASFFSGESSRSTTPERAMSDPGKSTPPKDFVCPITSNVFVDPVTLETGQTYERRAIKEWLERGNSTCPITRQNLHSTQLPRTNYVLKRLIASWQEQNPGPAPANGSQEYPDPGIQLKQSSPMPHSTSPTSVISILDGTGAQLRQAITKLCTSEILQESEMAVLRIERFWRDSVLEESEMMGMLSKPPMINGFVEILFNSVDPRVLGSTVFLLCELGWRDEAVVNTLTRVDSDVDCIVALFKKGLIEAVVLIYLLRHSEASAADTELVNSLLAVISGQNAEGVSSGMCIEPRTASILLLGQIIASSDEDGTVSSATSKVVNGKVVMESIVSSLEAESAEERIAAVGILLRCIRADGKCRNSIADKVELAPVLESFIGANDAERFEIIQFLSELVKLNRRSFIEQVLHIIKEEGPFSTMHTLLSYLQTASPEQSPVLAGLLLQLDLLAEPRKMSIFREEAIDALISCLRKIDLPSVQIAAANTIVNLHGRFSISGKPLTRAFLLKRAGLDKKYRSVMRQEKLGNGSVDLDQYSVEQKAADDWERKMAYALVSHEFGLIFEALADGVKSRDADLSSQCFLSATWLIHMLMTLPDTGVRGAARVCLMKHILSIFKSTKDIEDRALSMLALSSFVRDPEGLRDLSSAMKDVLRGLRELRKYSPLAVELLKILSEGNESSADLWNHKELVQVNCGSNGEVTSIVCFKDKIFSGHSDGTVKVWTGRGSILHLIQEVREHSKAVTSLAILSSGERLCSGSLDRTTKVWSISSESVQCIEVHDMKDQVHNLVVANSIACFIPQGAGIKVHSWNGASKLLNPNRHVKCLSLVQGKLYCGCHDNSIQEIDLATGTLTNIQSGSRKLLGKSNPVQAMQLQGGFLYTTSSPIDGAAVKIWNASNYEIVGSLASTSEVRSMAVSSELIYLGCKGGVVEVWCKEKHNRVETLQLGTNAKVISMALDADEEYLVVGTSDGRIQAWGLS